MRDRASRFPIRTELQPLCAPRLKKAYPRGLFSSADGEGKALKLDTAEGAPSGYRSDFFCSAS